MRVSDHARDCAARGAIQRWARRGHFDDGEDELVATASFEHDPFGSPEELAMTVRDRVPGAVDHSVKPGTEWDQLEPPEPEDSAE